MAKQKNREKGKTHILQDVPDDVKEKLVEIKTHLMQKRQLGHVSNSMAYFFAVRNSNIEKA